MYSEIGQFSLLIVAFSSLFSLLYILMKWVLKKNFFLSTLLSFVHMSFIFSFISMLSLIVAFVNDDFSLRYVTSHSNTQLPTLFKSAAVLGGHEGSLLFWVLTLAVWNSAIALHYRKLSSEYLAKVLFISSSLVCVFSFFTLFASNPFEVNPVFVIEGRDLNPMLQDVALIFHPPLLYIGYIGFSSNYALAFAALWQKELPIDWLVISRKFCLVAWSFLTAGILLGAWWAYYELGWGGWWFWDPVENASLLPWLTSTALIHSLMASQQEKSLMRWSYGLSFITFSLSILGTFVVRSGIITSVHAFAVDPTRGTILLGVLLLLILVGFGSQILRSNTIESIPITRYLSRRFLFLLGNGLFMIATITVLLGTFYPMIFQIFGWDKISVGAPYFNTLFAPLTFMALVLMSFALMLKYSATIWRRCFITGLAAVVFGFIVYRLQYHEIHIMVLVTWILCFFVFITMAHRLLMAQTEGNILQIVPMLFAHIGVVLLCIGASMNAFHSVETTAKLGVGEHINFEQFNLTVQSQVLFVGPNYTAEKLIFRINESDFLTSEKRHYQVRVMNMTEPGIKHFWHGDLYITLGEKLYDGSFAVRLQYKAYIQWVWLGGIFMVFGGVISLMFKQNIEYMKIRNSCYETN